MKNSELKIAVITGASSGIGEACARKYLSKGYEVFALGRNQKNLKKLPNAHSIKIDLTDEKQIIHFFSAFFKKRGLHLNVLINCAGLAKAGDVRKISKSEWEQVFDINVTTPFLMIREALPFLQKARGEASVVNVSSIAGQSRSLTLGAHYSASKAALLGMTRHMAVELGKKGIRINAVCPSQTLTPMLKEALTPKQKKDLAKKVPLGRLATPEEQAEVIYFLSTSNASYVHGASVNVNGGLL